MTGIQRRYAVAADVLRTLGRDLRETRVARGASQRDVASWAGIAPATVSYVERGDVSPSVEIAIRLLDWLDAHRVSDRERGSPLLRSTRPSSQTRS